jgi:hypothetical protein
MRLISYSGDQKLLQTTIIYNLRSGYAKLNDYCHKLNITESANCQCGERETVEHYILHCDQYEEVREKLIHDMFLLSGSMHLSLEVLLTVGADEEVSLAEMERIRLLAVQFTLCNFNTLILLIGGH